MRIITVSDINETKFYQLPKAFFHNPLYTSMKNESKIAYSLLRDLLDLSIKNNWINENREVYVKLSREKLMKYLNVKGKQKITEIMNELKKKELILEKQVGLKKCNEIYICIPEELDIIYSDEDLLEENGTQSIENTLKFENQTSRSSKIKTPEVRKSNFKTFENQTHIKTNNIKTNNIKTKINIDDDDSSKIISMYFDNFKFNKKTQESINELIKEYSYQAVENIILRMIELRNDGQEFNTPIRYLSSSLKNETTLKKNKNNRKNDFAANSKPKGLKFNNFPAREYDYDLLEKKLLGWVDADDGEDSSNCN